MLAGVSLAVPAPIHVDGRYFVDDEGYTVRLMGSMRSIHPFFDGGRWGGGDDADAAKRAVAYYDKTMNGLVDKTQGAYSNLIRLTDDGHWSNDDRLKPDKKSPHFYACDWKRYDFYVNEVLVPIVELAVKKGMYVIVRPSYNTPGETKVGDDYNRHLIREWRVLASNKKLQALSGQVLFELENEPTTVYAADGTRKESAMAEFFQPIVDEIRRCGFKGVVLVPGMGYQSYYKDYANYPVKDKNMGYAVHVYSGWYAQKDETADTDRFTEHFLKQVPVAMGSPIVVTEVDWSPIKPGKGKTNEFGQFVPANWGTWATASTSKWGKAYFGMLERLGNISTICGDSHLYYDIDEYLKTGKFKVKFDGEPECSPQAFFELYQRWAKEPRLIPAERDLKLAHPLLGEVVALKKVEHLTRHFFRLVNPEGLEFEINGVRNGSWDFRFAEPVPVGRNASNAALFKAWPITVDGATHYALKPYDANGIVRTSGRDGDNGDSVCAGKNWNGYNEGPTREGTEFKYGLEQDYDGLWDIAAVEGGFTFRNVAKGTYLGTRENPQSATSVVWKVETRAERKADRLKREAAERKHPLKPFPYRNPVIFADCPDVGLCADDEYYYMVSTTMHLMPGAPIMRSKDAVHWETISYGFDKFDEKPDFSLKDGKCAYGGGQWAASLRYHKGTFYLWFIANGCGGYLYTAKKAEGPWKLATKGPFLHDASILFDDDGKVYIFHGSGYVTEMKSDFSAKMPGGIDEKMFERGEETALLEGSSALKRNGYYYVMMISGFLKGHPRREVCYRSKSIKGPWEKQVILETDFDNHGGVGQGAVVKGPKGRWVALVFQDRGGIGRTPCLMPVRWENDWPMLGDRYGMIPNNPLKPYPDLSGITASDEFNSNSQLQLTWEWNHIPDDSKWSLRKRHGWLTLETVGTVDNLFMARNTLTQRMIGPESTGVVKMDVSKMKDGDHAGFCAFQGDSAVAEVVMEGGRRYVVLSRQTVTCGHKDGCKFVEKVETEEFSRTELRGDIVYLKVYGDFNLWKDYALVGWSPDGINWNMTEKKTPMRFDTSKFFMGAKFALFNYATKSPGGRVDFDFFRVETPLHEN